MIKSLQIKALFWIAVATWGLGLLIAGVPLDQALLKPSGVALGVVTAVVAIFERQAWRWRVFRPWLVSSPDLTGTYRGTIESFWTDQKSEQRPAPIQAFLSIHQTLSGLTVRLFTIESASLSLAASLQDSLDGNWDLVFTYRNEPDLKHQHRSRIHHGGARIRLDGKDCNRLTGKLLDRPRDFRRNDL